MNLENVPLGTRNDIGTYSQKLEKVTRELGKSPNKSLLNIKRYPFDINVNIKTVNFVDTNGNGARNADEESSQPMLRFMDNTQLDSVSIFSPQNTLPITMLILLNRNGMSFI